jgi:hypothetical protein
LSHSGRLEKQRDRQQAYWRLNSSAQPNVSHLNLATHNLRTGGIPPRPTDTPTPTQPHESNGLLTSLVRALRLWLSAAAAATAAAATTTDKFEITTTATVAAAIADVLSGYQATA